MMFILYGVQFATYTIGVEFCLKSGTSIAFILHVVNLVSSCALVKIGCK